ncbi:MAG: cysteine--tRNA ligase [Kiritimatiellaceae bacterium]|nr:cysteine--tRNA ligase [Kiritimatiellaceae bacterium]|tara:strand:+ start:5734 stop:7140 length:1407 start_codon:yes stop_codon:yes gene_type:complete
MAFHIYNTMSRKKEELVPLDGKKIRMYTCGPTVYNYAHIGNFRAYMFEDLLRRYIQFAGFEVEQVQNLTDVDDKTIRHSIEQGKSLNEFTALYKEAFFHDLSVLNIQPAEHYPAATDYIPQMIEMIQGLVDKGYGYQSEDGSVYYRIDKFDRYGCLARLDREGMRSGSRVSQDEYEKDNVADFALWKAHVESDGDVYWDSPWGRGRPGWHIECSAMSTSILGETFDLHTGGVDNIFPHHEDEIAQSEALSGKTYAKYWMHCGYLIVDGRKMSKSLGNFYTMQDLLDKGYSGREIRYELLATHYRQALNFTFASLEANRAALRRLDEFYFSLKEVAGSETEGATLPDYAIQAKTSFVNEMDDDMNISGAFGALFDLVHTGNIALSNHAVSAKEAVALLGLWAELDIVLGLLIPSDSSVPEEVEQLAALRVAARTDKNWEESDRLRDEIAMLGWQVKDGPEGYKLRKLSS